MKNELPTSTNGSVNTNKIKPTGVLYEKLPDQLFLREDESPDERFYREPRFTTHIDDATIGEITKYYRDSLSPSDRLLDLMSSWISHLPNEIGYRQVSGLGMNEAELARNPRLDDFIVQNLNTTLHLPYADDSYEAVMIIVSIQYLIKPFEIFAEIARVLTPGGKCIVGMSHRLFPSKAIYAFQTLSPVERCRLVSLYMEQTQSISGIQVIDRSPLNADPLWLVVGSKIK